MRCSIHGGGDERVLARYFFGAGIVDSLDLFILGSSSWLH